MVPLPADSIIQAAERWIDLLERSTVAQGWTLIRSDPAYGDLSPTQYASAIDWLDQIGLVPILVGEGDAMGHAQLRELALVRALESAQPAWLADSDVLISDGSDLPKDASELADELGLGADQTLLAIRQAHGEIDLARRAEIGELGEAVLVAELEKQWPGSTDHVALHHDGFGYDVGLTVGGHARHIEVKSTNRRGRLSVYVSRHEYEVAKHDPDWGLVVVGLDENRGLACVATVRHRATLERAPKDTGPGAHWEASKFELSPRDLQAGLAWPFVQTAPIAGSVLLDGGNSCLPPFSWMPT